MAGIARLERWQEADIDSNYHPPPFPLWKSDDNNILYDSDYHEEDSPTEVTQEYLSLFPNSASSSQSALPGDSSTYNPSELRPFRLFSRILYASPKGSSVQDKVDQYSREQPRILGEVVNGDIFLEGADLGEESVCGICFGARKARFEEVDVGAWHWEGSSKMVVKVPMLSMWN